MSFPLRSARFHFTSTWVLDAPREQVFDALRDHERWPEWWRGAEQMHELAPVDAQGLGGRAHYVWRSRIGYRLQFEGSATVVERPSRLQGTVDGDLVGVGEWRLFERADGSTVATYLWDVRTSGAVRSLLSRILRPLLVASHDQLMRDGAAGLARHLNVRLLSASGAARQL